MQGTKKSKNNQTNNKIRQIISFFSTRKTKLFLLPLMAFLVFLLLTIFTYHLAYRNKIYPRIKIAGITVSNLTKNEAQSRLEEKIKQINQENPDLILRFQNQERRLNLNYLSIGYDIASSIDLAYSLGRTRFFPSLSEKVLLWLNGRNLKLAYHLDQAAFQSVIATISEGVFIPAVEPTIDIVRLDEQNALIKINPGQSGRNLDERIFRSIISDQIARLNFSPLDLPLITTSPALTETEIKKISDTAQKLLGKKIILAHEEMSWTLEEKELISFLSFSGGFDQLKISDYTSQLADSISQLPANALFRFENNRVIEFKPALFGRSLNQPGTLKLITEVIQNLIDSTENTITITLPVDQTEPAITTANTNNLGIKELIGRGESWFKGSISSRIHNLKLASDKINGLLIAPAEVFSFNQNLGDVSEATGYQKAYIIKDGRTILGDGGGVCQVSTTLFRSALAAGLPIIERQAHAYRVSYYEQNTQVGLDATVYHPTTDFKFKNDTPAYILIQTNVDLKNYKLTFDLYGQSDGRIAEISKSRIWEQTPPPPALYQDDPELPIGTTKQIDWPAWGAKVAFDWKVSRNGEILQEKTFYSNYKPWQAVYLLGTKTE